MCQIPDPSPANIVTSHYVLASPDFASSFFVISVHVFHCSLRVVVVAGPGSSALAAAVALPRLGYPNFLE